MKTTGTYTLTAFALLAMLGTLPLATGCGGSNSATGGSAGSRTEDARTGGSDTAKNAARGTEATGGRMGLFVTTAPGRSAAFEHVWATIQKVELLDMQEKWVTVFESVEGATLDLSRLNAAEGSRYHLLGCASVPPGRSYVRAKVTFGKSFQVFAPGANVAKTLPLAEAMGRDTQEMPAVTFPLEKPRDLGGGREDLVLEFDLSKFETKAEGKDGKDETLLPFVREGATTGLSELSRQEPARFVGTVGNITAKEDGTAFTLALEGGRTLAVQATEATVFHNDGPTPNPKLENGKQVAVFGILSPQSRNLIATAVAIHNGDTKPTSDIVTLRGVLSGVNPKAGTMAVTATQVHGLTPTMNAITVTVAPDAVLRSSGGVLLKPEEFYGALGAGRNAVATFQGTYEPVTGAMKATRIKLEEAMPGGGHEAAAHGTPKEVQADAGTLVLDSLTEWDGIAARGEGKGVPVVTTAATAFRDDKGEYLASTSFFTGAASGEKSVRVTGIYAGGVLTATRLDLLPPAPKPEAKEGGAAANVFTVGPSPEEQKAPEGEMKPDPSARPVPEEKPGKPADPAKTEPMKAPEKPGLL
jgi:hypothetical protein